MEASRVRVCVALLTPHLLPAFAKGRRKAGPPAKEKIVGWNPSMVYSVGPLGAKTEILDKVSLCLPHHHPSEACHV